MTQKTQIKTMSAPTAFDYFLILLAALIWASAFIAIKFVVQDFSPLLLSTSRVLIGFVFLISYLGIYMVFNKNLVWPSGKQNWIKLFIIAALYTSIPFTLINWGQQYISATLTSIVMGASPLIGYFNAHFATKDEKLNPLKIFAVILGTVGILIAIDFNQDGGFSGNIWGVIAMMAALYCYSVSGLITRRLTNGDATIISTIILGIGSIYLIPVAYFTGQFDVDFSAFKTETLWAVVYLGVFPTGIAYLIRFYLILKIGFTAFLTTVYFIPIFGVLLSALLLGEDLSLNIFIALGLIITSLLISRLANKKT
ncbi:MAG: DMT family transporter [Hyphomicrobiales bacterium]